LYRSSGLGIDEDSVRETIPVGGGGGGGETLGLRGLGLHGDSSAKTTQLGGGARGLG